jgi:hypothetical protein
LERIIAKGEHSGRALLQEVGEAVGRVAGGGK